MYLAELRYAATPDTYKVIDRIDTLPVSLEEVKQHLVIYADDDSQDARLTRLIRTAVAAFEGYTRRTLLLTTFVTYRNNFPFTHFIELRKSPLISVASVTYRDSAGDWQTMDEADYTITEEMDYSKIMWESTYNFPRLYNSTQCIRIEFTVGMFNGALPWQLPHAFDSMGAYVIETLKEGLLDYIAFMYSMKGDCIYPSGSSAYRLPPVTLAIFDGFKIMMI